jgi:hypothetical protein
MLEKANAVFVRYIILHGLLPRQTQETVDCRGDAEYHRGEPKGIDGIFKRSIMAVKGEL